eukprot:CAMPEP_0202862894 /NCGR_PEP_ID=MMETSP1391-20130828/3761_1 /ASSEMBLY_ACC=CAM_ASM_000867 /TAXON_ID=1034604 /ORGANISM="Chlamydomonas leiostraca, Strain SAG 11-49" /LENGTH=615 /DNA_ID=CAMNT_0049542483 /DNA_START=220 /DNA_END=2068 /DNA_ORIENTATION=+
MPRGSAGCVQDSSDEDDPLGGAALVLYGPQIPKACECFLQIRRHFCLPQAPDDSGRCDLYTARHTGVARCYTRGSLPPERQYSDWPDPGEANVSWWVPPHELGRRAGPGEHFAQVPYSEVVSGKHNNGKGGHENGGGITPMMGRTPTSLSTAALRGATTEAGALGPLPANQHLQSASASGVSPDKTVHRLTGLSRATASAAGEVSAYQASATARKGGGGMDCSRSVAWGPELNDTRQLRDRAYNRTHVRIYRYELPWNISHDCLLHEAAYHWDRLYGAFQAFETLLAQDWVVRTENPWEANLFYVQANTYLYSQNVIDPTAHVARVLNYVRMRYPTFWRRNRGKDHVIWIPGDMGPCLLPGARFIQYPIKLAHFGLQVHKNNYTNMPGARPAEWIKGAHEEYSCFKHEKDVVVPPHYADFHHIDKAEATFQASLAANHSRPYLLFFAGTIRDHQAHYSGGARQAFHKHLVAPDEGKSEADKLYPDLKFGGPASETGYQAQFCLIPYGDGWGNRIMFAAYQACIPVITQDYVHQPFDEVIPYEEFAVRIRNLDIPDLVHHLRAIPQSSIHAMRAAWHKYWSAYFWYPDHGGTAYNWTIRSLHKKLYNLWGHHYRLQ